MSVSSHYIPTNLKLSKYYSNTKPVFRKPYGSGVKKIIVFLKIATYFKLEFLDKLESIELKLFFKENIKTTICWLGCRDVCVCVSVCLCVCMCVSLSVGGDPEFAFCVIAVLSRVQKKIEKYDR